MTVYIFSKYMNPTWCVGTNKKEQTNKLNK